MDRRTPQRKKPRVSECAGLETLRLDPEDEYLRDACFLTSAGYARLSRGDMQLHTYLMDPPEGFVVDHINGDRLDNRKENLRVVTQAENVRNSDVVRALTGFKGVYPNRGRFAAQIRYGGKGYHLGIFDTAEEANVVRLLREKELWGIQPRRLPDFIAAGLA